MKKNKLAIVGATGLVGQTLLDVLKEEKFLDKFKISLFVSENSSGKRLILDGDEYPLVSLNSKWSNELFDFVFFSAGDEISKKWAKKFIQNGAIVIDNSNAFRRDPSVPLVVPEINAYEITKQSKLIANPNCSTIQLVLALDKLRLFGKIKKVIVSTYQSVSGAGSKAIFDLQNHTNFEIKENINSNVIAKIGDIKPNGFCEEEDKIMFETKKILSENVFICASTARVPVEHCHLESVFVEFCENVDFQKINCIAGDETVEFCKDIVLNEFVYGQNKTYVFRLRKVSENEICFFVLADNLRRGAAFNAVKILKHILQMNENVDD